MFYINQLDYAHIPYNHNMAAGGPPEGRNTVRSSGCGLCCACMMVAHQTGKELPIEDYVKLSEENLANQQLGTNMKVLGPVLAELFGLEYVQSSDKDELITWLKDGGEAIVHAQGDKDDHIGLFSNRGHYILATAMVGDEVQIMDPSDKPEKYEVEGRKGKVRKEVPYIYAAPELVDEACYADRIHFHMFKKKQ